MALARSRWCALAVVAGCAAPTVAVPANRAPLAARARVTPSRQLALDALGAELIDDDPVHVRKTADGQRSVACVAPPPEVSCMVFERDAPYHLDVLSRDAARSIDTGEASPGTIMALRHDMEIFRTRLGRGSRALTRACASDRALSCIALGAGVTIRPDAYLDVPSAGELAALSAFAFETLSCGVHLLHAEVWADASSRTLFVVADVQSDCDSQRSTIGHTVELP